LTGSIAGDDEIVGILTEYRGVTVLQIDRN